MERQRRISLKNCFDTLKATVPSIAKKEKASKVAILNGAFADIQTLQTTNDSLTKEFAKQRSRNILLKQRLTELRREADKQRRLQQQY
ncbi:Max-binding protein MNT [Camponotus floridanus]|uniref:Max-binding protein MNT n=2 Tax=Camponotus floridanus TaxID=104421 RepID=E2B1S9_CAMFO|nr:Max-binding protein MNT [Camponotus floridanus]